MYIRRREAEHLMEITIQQLLKQAITAHKEGKIQDAERLYRAILQSQPKHPDANHNLGVLATLANKGSEALPLFKIALKANPKIDQFWLSYIEALIKEKQFDNAKQVFEQAKKRGVKGDKIYNFEAQLTSEIQTENVSYTSPSKQQLSILHEFYQNGRFSDAEKLAVQITQLFPKHQFAWKVLGAVLAAMGRKSEAVNANQTAVALSPQDVVAHINLGITFHEIGMLDEAEASHNKAIALKPDYAQAHYNLGITLQELGRLDEALASYNQAIVLKPDYVEAYNNLGVTFEELGKLDDALANYNQAIALMPDYAEAHSNLGVVLEKLGRLDEALARYNQAISLKPDVPEAHYNLGNKLKELGRWDLALASYSQAIALKRDFAEAHNNMGNTLQEMGRLDEAEESFTQATALKPNFSEAFWNLHGIQNSIKSAEHWIDKCLEVDVNHLNARLAKAALRFYQGDRNFFDELTQSELKQHPQVRSLSWVFNLTKLPELHFNKFHFFDAIVKKSIVSKPFYEFGVWRASSFKYLIKVFKKGYGFDTFTGLPEDWRRENGSVAQKKGKYTSDGNVPKIKGGEFIVGRFEDTLPIFFSETRPTASVINFDADLYSSTICALNFSKQVMDRNTILIFDEFIMNEGWEQDEFRALNEFCSFNHFSYDVIAISFFTKQVAVKLIGI